MAKKARSKSGGSDDDRDPVGYGNPPRHTRFKPGTSGNPKGRPLRNQEGVLIEIIGKELYQPVRIQQDGHSLVLPRIQVAVRRMTVDAMKGLPQAVRGMVQLAQLHDQELATKTAKQPAMSQEETVSRIIQILSAAKDRKEAKEKREKAKRESDNGSNK
jgi:hypothetical protein